MPIINFESLLFKAQQIKNETEDGRNTAQRVGGFLEQFVNSTNEESELHIKLEEHKGKNRFNMNADFAVVTESTSHSTGYKITKPNTSVEAFQSGTNATKHLNDNYGDYNIKGCATHPYFGFGYDADKTTSHKIKLEADSYVVTFYDGGITRYVSFYKEDGTFVGFKQGATSSDNHVSFSKSEFPTASYFRFYEVTANLGFVQVEEGTTPTSYEPFGDSKTIPEDVLPENILTEEKLAEVTPTTLYAQDIASYNIEIFRGSWSAKKPVIGSGSLYVSNYVEISGGLVYCFAWINECFFYDANKNVLDSITLSANYAYQAPENAKYMAVQFNGTQAVRCIALKPSDYSYSEIKTRILNTTEESKRCVNYNTRSHFATYVIGDSEAARFFSFVKSIHFNKIVSSFGGHRTDFIATNVGKGTSGLGDLVNVKGCNVLVVSGTNDMFSGSTSRMIAYHRELISTLHKMGAVEIYAIAPFLGLDHTVAEFRSGDFYAAMKRLYGGKFIDIVGHVIDSGLYFNPYHPIAFTQPSVGGSVNITFEDASALTECGMISNGKDFYIRYYDDKVDKYTCNSVSGNVVNSTLVSIGSDCAVGSNAGQYVEQEDTPAWSGTKTTLGWVYADNDVWTIEQGKLPWHIYPDHSVHFGKILARIIDQVLPMYLDLTDE